MIRGLWERRLSATCHAHGTDVGAGRPSHNYLSAFTTIGCFTENHYQDGFQFDVLRIDHYIRQLRYRNKNDNVE
jgi:hypothetical protein